MNLTWSRELKLLAVTYFSVTFTITTFSHADELTPKSVLNLFLSAFGSMGISPLTKKLWDVNYSRYDGLILDHRIVIMSTILSLFATLGTILSIIAISLISETLKLPTMPQGFIKVAIPLGITIVVLSTTKFPTIFYSVVPLVLSISISLCDRQTSLSRKIIVVFMTIVISLLTVVILDTLAKDFMVLLCTTPLVLLAFLRNRNSSELHEEIEVQEGGLEEQKAVRSSDVKRSYKKIYLIRLAP